MMRDSTARDEKKGSATAAAAAAARVVSSEVPLGDDAGGSGKPMDGDQESAGPVVTVGEDDGFAAESDVREENDAPGGEGGRGRE